MASPLRGEFNTPHQQPSTDGAGNTELSPLDAAVSKLESITVTLRYLQLALPLATLLCLTLLLIGHLHLLGRANFYSAMLVGGFAVMLVIIYEIAVKRGNVIFEEISDELQWHIEVERTVNPMKPQGETSKGSIAPERPAIHTRVVLRSFAQATDLPLLPGRYGPGLYTLINILLISWSVWQMNAYIYR